MFTKSHLEMLRLRKAQEEKTEERQFGHSAVFGEEEFLDLWKTLKQIDDPNRALFMLRKLSMARRWSIRHIMQIMALFPLYYRLNIFDFILIRLMTEDMEANHLRKLVEYFHRVNSARRYVSHITNVFDTIHAKKSIQRRGLLSDPIMRDDKLCQQSVQKSQIKDFLKDLNAQPDSSTNTRIVLKTTMEYLITSPLSYQQVKYILSHTNKLRVMMSLFEISPTSMHPLSVRQLVTILRERVMMVLEEQLVALKVLSRYVTDPEHMWPDKIDPEPSLNLVLQYFQEHYGDSGRRKSAALLSNMFAQDFTSSMNCRLNTNQSVIMTRYDFVVSNTMRVLVEQLGNQDCVEVNVIRCSNLEKVNTRKCFDRARPLNKDTISRISQFLRNGALPKGEAVLLESLKMAFDESPDVIYLVTDSCPSHWKVVAKAKGSRKRQTLLSEEWRKEIVQDDWTDLLVDALRYYWPQDKICPVRSTSLFLSIDERDNFKSARNFLFQLARATKGSFRMISGFAVAKSIAKNRTNKLISNIQVERSKIGTDSYLINVFQIHLIRLDKGRARRISNISKIVLIVSYLLMLFGTFQMLDRRGMWDQDGSVTANNTVTCVDIYNLAPDGVLPDKRFFYLWSLVYLCLGICVVVSVLPDRRRVYSFKDASPIKIYSDISKSNLSFAMHNFLNLGVLMVFSSGSVVSACILMIVQIVNMFVLQKRENVIADSCVANSESPTGWEWIDVIVLSPLSSFLLSFTLVILHLTFFSWYENQDYSLFTMKMEWTLVSMGILSVIAIVGTFHAKKLAFGLPIMLYHMGILYRWSNEAFDSTNSDNESMRSIVRCSFVMFCALGVAIVYVTIRRVIVYVQITATKFVLPPDRVKMRRIVGKQVLNFTVFLFMIFAVVLRSGTLGLTFNSTDGKVELDEDSRADTLGLTSPLNGVCGRAIWTDRVDIVMSVPESWWFRMVWIFLGYLLLTACFQLLPYTFMTVKGKWLEHRIMILGLRTTFVRNFMTDFVSIRLNCPCSKKSYNVSILPKFWKWGLTKATYRTFHTRMGSSFAIMCITGFLFHIVWSFDWEVIAFMVLTLHLIVVVRLGEKVGVGLNFGYISHKMDKLHERMQKLEKKYDKIEKKEKKHERKVREKRIKKAHTVVEKKFGCAEMYNKILRCFTKKKSTRKDSKKIKFAGRVLLYFLYWPICLYIGWISYAWVVMATYVLRQSTYLDVAVEFQFVAYHIGTVLILTFSIWRHELICLIPYVLGIGATMHMNLNSTCNTLSYTGYDYRYNYIPPLHTQWDVTNSSFCTSTQTDWLNISNTYKWLENGEGTSKCRLVLDFDRSITTGTLSVTSNSTSLTSTTAGSALSSTVDTFANTSTSTSTMYILNSTSSGTSHTVSFAIYPYVSNTSNIGNDIWESAYERAASIENDLNTFTISDLTSTEVFYAIQESECPPSPSILSSDQINSKSLNANIFPAGVKTNRGFTFISGPLSGRGYCAEDPGTCDILSVSDLLFETSGRTLEKRQFQECAIDLFVIAVVAAVLKVGSYRKRQRKKRFLKRHH